MQGFLMFNLGLFEILILGSIALLVVGPKNLPYLAQKVGEYLANLRRMSNGFKQSVSTELNLDQELETFKKFQQEAAKIGGAVSEELQSSTKKNFSNKGEKCMNKNGKS